MPAYIIARVQVTDGSRYQEYTKLTPAAIARFGGRFIVRGGKVVTLEGEREERRLVVIEFPSMEQAQAWYHSEEYRGPKEMRFKAADADFLIADGY